MGKIMGGKNKENEIVISLNGNQSEEVVGSNMSISYLSDTGRKCILVEVQDRWAETLRQCIMQHILPGKVICPAAYAHIDHIRHGSPPTLCCDSSIEFC